MMRVYIVIKNDYRYVNGRFFPVDTFGADIKCALDHMNIFVGVYESLIAAQAAVDEDIRVHFNINEVVGQYKSSMINIEKHYYGYADNPHWAEIDVLLPDSNRVNQIQMIYNITVKDFETPVDDDKKGIQLKDLKSEDIDSIAEEAAKKLSEENDKKDAAVQCYINDHDIDFVGKNNKQSSVTITENNGHETYNEDLLYELSLHTDIFTRFYDMRSREFGNNLVIELTGVFPDKDNFNPNNISTLAAYITDPVEGRKCIYEDTYNGYNETGIFSNFFDFLNYYYENINEFDNVYIVDKRHLSEQKEPSKEEEKKPENEDHEKVDEDDEYIADECFIDDNTIDFVGPGNRRTSAQVSKDYSDETYNEDLLYELADATDIYTHFYDIRERKPGKNLVLELTGVQPIRDNYDPDNTTWVKAYCTDAVKERKCVYEVKYPMMLSDISYNIIFNFLNFADDNLDLSEYDNLYIVDERVHPVEKESSKEEEKDHKKAIECTISTSDYNNDNTLLVFKFKIDGTCSTKSLIKVATNTEEFIRYLKQYTDGHTKFIDERVGSSWIAFYNRISYDCYIIEMDADTITLKHYNHSNGTIDISFKTERRCFEEVLDKIEDANIVYIRDETAW